MVMFFCTRAVGLDNDSLTGGVRLRTDTDRAGGGGSGDSLRVAARAAGDGIRR